MKTPKTKWIIATTLAWIFAIVFGAGFLSKYSNTPGAAAENKPIWPAASGISKSADKPMMVIFAHPQCPCSVASVNELARLMPHFKNKIDVTVVFVRPQGRDPAWVQDSLWKTARDIPGVKTVMDGDYRETDLFGAKTSGQTMLYDANGALVFSGGITPARGHMGDSDGRDFLLSWLAGESKEMKITKVFGCALKEMGEMHFGRTHGVE